MTAIRIPAQNGARPEDRREGVTYVPPSDPSEDQADYIEIPESQIPAAARGFVASVLEASSALLELESPPALRWFDLDDGSGREIAFHDHPPLWGRAVPAKREIWLWSQLAGDRRQLARTCAHEVAHIGGLTDEEAAEQFATRLLARAEDDRAPRTLEEFIDRLSELTGVTPEQAQRALWRMEDEQRAAERATQDAAERAQAIASALRRAARRAAYLHQTWVDFSRQPSARQTAAQAFEERLDLLRRERVSRDELAALLCHDKHLIADVLARAGAPATSPPVLAR